MIDFRKLQPRLLTKWPTIPIEIVPTSAPSVLRALKRLGSPKPFLRLGGAAKAGPIITDNGNFIVDAPFPQPLRLGPGDLLQSTSKSEHGGGSVGASPGVGGNGGDGDGIEWDVPSLAKRLKNIVGVVEIGLFWGRNGLQAAAGTNALTSNGDGDEPGGQKPVAAYFGMEGGEVLVRSSANS